MVRQQAQPAAHVEATIELVGKQKIEVDAHSRGEGAHLSITIATVMLVFLDQESLARFARSWIVEAAPYVKRLPAVVPATAHIPRIGLIVTIRRTDRAAAGAVDIPGQHSRVVIYAGPTTWTVQDLDAYTAVTSAIKRATGMASYCLPKSVSLF